MMNAAHLLDRTQSDEDSDHIGERQHTEQQENDFPVHIGSNPQDDHGDCGMNDDKNGNDSDIMESQHNSEDSLDERQGKERGTAVQIRRRITVL